MATRCPFCGQGVLEHRTVRETYTYQGHDLEVDQPGEFCNRCDEGIITGKDMKASEQAFHDLRANVDGLLTSGEVRRIRTKLKLSQRRAGEIFGGGPNAFSRYERGVAMQPKAVDALLHVLDSHPKLLAEITTPRAA